jgi:diguanylate cyclase (GGDEF)-like protein
MVITYVIAGAVLTALIGIFGTALIIQRSHLLRSRDVLSAVVENVSQGLVIIDEKHQVLLISGRAVELLAIPSGLVAHARSADVPAGRRKRGQDIVMGINNDGRGSIVDEIARFDIQDACFERILPGGRELEVRTQRLASGGAMRTFTDITERKQSEKRIRHLACHDALTGLPNRTLLNDRLSQALSLAARNGGALVVLALNLDRFKAINDHFGRAAGDRLLVLAAGRLKSTLRAADTIARIGGNDFVVLQTGTGQPSGAGALARRLIAVLSEPFQLDDHQAMIAPGSIASISTCIGIAMYPADGDDPEALLKNADTALCRAKANERGSFCFFEAQMDLTLRERWALERDLRLAIGTEQLFLHYQPIFATATRSITGFEALLRWRHPNRGNIPPMEFIPIAEETGMILVIGAWVLEDACRTAARWPEPKRLAVNLSAAQLRSDELPSQVADILRRTGLPAGLLELEVTETVLISNYRQALATLRTLRGMGVHIACDDFGTGYSSFSYLQNLAFDRIKIDQSFVRELGVTPSAQRIVHAILAMAHSLDLDVTAEGVETETQLSILRGLGCLEVQGFLLGRPAQSGAFTATLAPVAVTASSMARNTFD